MSLIFTRQIRVAGVLTNADSTPTISIIRTDTSATVQATTNMTAVSTGIYSFTLSSPIAGVTYRATFTVIVNGATYSSSSDQTASDTTGQSNLHSVTFAALQRVVKLALQQTPDAQLAPTSELVNDALVQFVSLRPWNFRNGALSLDLTEDQSYVTLPADFGRLESIHYNSSQATGLMVPRTISEIVFLRGSPSVVTVTTRSFYYAVNWQTQSSVTDLPTARLELFPTPSETIADALTGHYTRQIRKMTSSTDVPDIPSPFHQALKRFCRIHALCEFGIKQWDEEMQAFAPMLDALVNEDGGDQDNLGRMIGVGSGERRMYEPEPIIIPRA